MKDLMINNELIKGFEYRGKFSLNNDFIKKYKAINKSLKEKVRPIIFQNDIEKSKLINKFRRNGKVQDIVKFQEIIILSDIDIFPDIFPKSPQIYSKEYFLEVIPVEKQLEIQDLVAKKNHDKLIDLINKILLLNKLIIEKKYDRSQGLIQEIIENYGYSYLVIRKMILLKELSEDTPIELSYIDEELEKYNNGDGGVIINSLIQCFDRNLDFLNLKKSIMSVSTDGDYIDSVIRVPFIYKSYKNYDDINKFGTDLNYGFQSSFIDGLLFLKRNSDLYNQEKYKQLATFIELLESSDFDIEDLAVFYTDVYKDLDDIEDIFFKHSSAWYEIEGVEVYRIFQDLFYDDVDSTYSDYKKNVSNFEHCIEEMISKYELLDLLSFPDKTLNHKYNLKKMMINGSITRSSIFNYQIQYQKDNIKLDNKTLYWIMSHTQDLARTIDYELLRMVANRSNDLECKVIYYLLINKRSKNERDNHLLRKFLEKIVINNFEGDIVKFVEYQSTKSKEVAEFTYETCTEDFIAKLTHITKDTASITSTRARLHIWMGEKNNDRTYIERARTLLIDHKINKIRNEIHDYRIYVDAVRFNEWISDEVIREFNTVLNSLEKSGFTEYQDSPQLLYLIEKVYGEFCNNKIYGISSYLGRRIRHGTFKGVMFHNIISLVETKFQSDIRDEKKSIFWEEWKIKYEKIIDDIIATNLHVKSEANSRGLIQPTIVGSDKNIIAKSCIQDLMNSYSVNGSSVQLNNILIEYCWRLIADDLKSIHSFLKIKQTLVLDFTSETKIHNNFSNTFYSELHKLVRESFSIVFEWFKRPQSVAPKAEIGLLLKAVIEEVKETCSYLRYDEKQLDSDYELIGGAYHVIYDALFIIIYNAAIHGNTNKKLDILINFDIENNKFIISVSSWLKDEQDENEVSKKLLIPEDADVSDAQTYEGSSGILKLHHLKEYDNNFDIEKMICQDGKVKFVISYKVTHSV